MAMKKPKGVRWGKVSEISKIKSIGDAAYKAAPRRLKHLSAWRRMHMLQGHSSISMRVKRAGIAPSSDLPLKGKVAFVRKFGG